MSDIIFPTPMKEGRPVRCSEATRRFAKESLDGKYGRDALSHPYLTLPEELRTVSPRERYDAAILQIAKEAPLRHCEGELLCGAATLGGAIRHQIPACFAGEGAFSASVSHLTCNFDRVVKYGLNERRDLALARLGTLPADDPQVPVLRSVLNAYEAARVFHERYLSLLEDHIADAASEEERAYYGALYENLENVPFAPAKTFREGVQSVWFSFAFLRLCGNWPGIGRLDLMLEPLYQADLAAGRITEDEARELLAHFMIKGCEWINLLSRGSGDAQHYQNLVIAGCDETGTDRTGTVTRLILEIVEEFPIADFPIAVRCSPASPAWLKPKMAEVIRHGGGVVAMYNEPLIIDSLVRFGYPVEEARQFANDGCWEVQIPGRTRFGYCPMDLYGAFESRVLHLMDDTDTDFADFESLYAAFRAVMDGILDKFHADTDNYLYESPTGVIDLFETGCVERGRSYYNGGPVYSAFAPHFGGIPDTANAMYAIKKLVFEEKRLSFRDFMQVLKNDWEGEEPLRQYVRSRYTYYGNDNDEVDFLVARIVKDYVEDCRRVKIRREVLRPPGISTFGRQIDWRGSRAAAPHGFRKGDILAGNISPTPSTDHAGATAIIKSACKTDYSDLTCGTVLDIRLDPKAVSGDRGVTAIDGLLSGFLALGGFFLQIDVVDTAVLLEAQKHPEQYQSLAVRVSGWSARFVTLNEYWQKMVIERTEQGL